MLERSSYIDCWFVVIKKRFKSYINPKEHYVKYTKSNIYNKFLNYKLRHNCELKK